MSLTSKTLMSLLSSSGVVKTAQQATSIAHPASCQQQQ
jgi:hypothetical protein